MLYITGIEIYETYHPGSVIQLLSWNYGTGSWVEIWSAPNMQAVDLGDTSRIFQPTIVVR